MAQLPDPPGTHPLTTQRHPNGKATPVSSARVDAVSQVAESIDESTDSKEFPLWACPYDSIGKG